MIVDVSFGFPCINRNSFNYKKPKKLYEKLPDLVSFMNFIYFVIYCNRLREKRGQTRV